MIERNLELDEEIYFLEHAESFMEIREHAESIIYEGKENIEEKKKCEKHGDDIITIDLGCLKFAVYPIKNGEIKNKAKILKTRKRINYGKISINNRIEEFKTNLCFVIFYSQERKFDFAFEELLEKIIEKIDIYKKL
ncbi:hypothetical protein EII29_03525 [Leptotrichia sp. OH3620_COT-345]|uniref:hypothetical protein n=1 Tax=Leptotrichia sp. OH3620_COT-345 TaxID=2491048 RepID=UPI000F6552D8|nr:hypothetical protein [Leptotrichia sp. OH3620_COT-345]RRD40182.1 hypothetical protein EII29_03525 [Leptotrichia sp. OH3620_COT-345]